MTGRALQSVGDTLRPYCGEARVLDLFAGSGRIGAQLLAEGAREAVFVEGDVRRAKELRADLEKRWKEKVRVVSGDVFRFLEKAPADEPFDLLAADPPFPRAADEYFARLLTLAARVAAPGSILLVKSPRAMLPSDVAPWTLWKDTRFGDSGLRYFTYGQR